MNAIRKFPLGALAILLLATLWPQTTPAQTPLPNIATIDGGWRHTCAVTNTGGARCWGYNGTGQIGDGTQTMRLVPVDVPGYTSGIASISTGYEHSCALTTAGAVKCWGRNAEGQLGDNSISPRLAPVDVFGLGSGITSITTGSYHSCAVKTGGGVTCWGANATGQVLPGSMQYQVKPVDVPGLASGFLKTVGGSEHTCALTTTGGIKCWGGNTVGQLGDGTTVGKPPVDVVGLGSGVTAITAGSYFTCALTTGGGVKCWGANDSGQVGDGSITTRPSPTDVQGLTSGVTAITAGAAHACALTSAGGVKCWGANPWGQIGDGGGPSKLTPVNVAGLASGVVAISAGFDHVCAVTAPGGVKCWGANFSGGLGDNTTAGRVLPVDVYGFGSGVAAISTTRSHTLALDGSSGRIYAWGSDAHGQLGQGRAINRPAPARVGTLAGITHISLYGHALAVDAYKQVWAWGGNECGQLGSREGPITSRPGRVIGLNNVTRVAAGGCFSLALKSDGTVWAWGEVPGYGTGSGLRQLSGLSNIVEIAAGTSHALARRGGDNAVFAFGDNANGQLGLGAAGAARTATQVTGVFATDIAAGDTMSMARLADGKVQIWGRHADGTLIASPLTLTVPTFGATSISVTGNTPYLSRTDGLVLTYRATPAGWTTLSGYTAITKVTAGGASFDFGIGAGGQVFARGSNTAGQLGQGDSTTRNSAVTVPGMTAAQVVAGTRDEAVLALKPDGTVWFWGADRAGESGDGGATASSVPLLVNVPAAIKMIATGESFSVALDDGGYVWGWGDNEKGPLGASLVSRSTPEKIAGVATVQGIAAGGNAFIAYLTADGTVYRSGTLPPLAGPVDPTQIPNLTNVLELAAGPDFLLARRIDGTVWALGENGKGQLGNGTTTDSGTPVQVQGISGSVIRISAGARRASAVTSDGSVWSWGEGPLGNGGSGDSLTAVQVTGVADAVEVASGSLGSLIRRQGGSLLAWGDFALSDAAGQNTLAPYAVAFHEPVTGIAAGASNKLAYLLGNHGVAWGFGNYGSASAASASVGDGAYVERGRPAAVLAAGGAGSVDASNWFLDLDSSTADLVPAQFTPKALGLAQISGAASGLAMSATVKYRAADYGKPMANFVFGLVPTNFFSVVKSAPSLSPAAKLAAKAAKADGFVLAQLTPSGWADVTGQLIAYSQGTANAVGGSVNILNGIDTTLLPGARFCVGYGESSDSMLTLNSVREVLLLAGAAANVSGVPCILSGLYVDGPASAPANTPATFQTTVVGITPTGSVQFKDGAAALSGSVGLALANDAVAKVSLTTTLALGSHAIGATYSGDGQNAAMSAEIPLRFEVVNAPPGSTTTALAGPASSALGSEAVFTAMVAGTAPTGTVQFADNGAPLGSAVPIIGGVATLRSSALAAGAHAISATYSGDAGNSGSPSASLSHTVYEAITTTVTLTSNATTSFAGSPVTFTATVSGADPTGSVTFRDGGAVLATVVLVNGSASYTVSSFGSGQHFVTADYSGDGNDPAATSSTVFQQVGLSAPPRLVNISTRGLVLIGNDVMIGGFIIGGAVPKKVLITVRGPSLAAFGVTGAMANPALQLFAGQTLVAVNDDWQTNVPSVVSEIVATGIAPSNPLESALMVTLVPGAYTAIVSGVNGGTGVGIVEVFEESNPEIPLINISTRGQVQTGDNVMIGGFIIQGDAPQKVLVTARGPSLAPYGIANPLANPVLQLFSGQTMIASNDDWQTNANVTDIQATGVAPTNPLESAILITLNPGAYTAIVSGMGGGTGVGIVEVFAR